MSTALSSVRLPAVSTLWPRARRLLVLAMVAAAGAALVVASSVPHQLAVAVVHVQTWMLGLSPVQVFLGLMGLFAITVGISIATAIDADARREWFDVR